MKCKVKQKLTLEKAEELAGKIFSKFKDEDKKFNLLHAKSVGEIALILAENKEVDRKILDIAGWVHDIGKVETNEEHAKKSVEILERDFEIDEKLKDCILNHGSDGKPKTEEGKIIKVADKACFVNSGVISLLLKYSLKKNKKYKEKDLEFIRKMCNKAVDLLGGL